MLENRFSYLVDSLVLTIGFLCIKSQLFTPIERDKKAREKDKKHTTYAKRKISKVVFLVRRIFRATLEKRKPTQVMFKLSF